MPLFSGCVHMQHEIYSSSVQELSVGGGELGGGGLGEHIFQFHLGVSVMEHNN